MTRALWGFWDVGYVGYAKKEAPSFPCIGKLIWSSFSSRAAGDNHLISKLRWQKITSSSCSGFGLGNDRKVIYMTCKCQRAPAWTAIKKHYFRFAQPERTGGDWIPTLHYTLYWWLEGETTCLTLMALSSRMPLRRCVFVLIFCLLVISGLFCLIRICTTTATSSMMKGNEYCCCFTTELTLISNGISVSPHPISIPNNVEIYIAFHLSDFWTCFQNPISIGQWAGGGLAEKS